MIGWRELGVARPHNITFSTVLVSFLFFLQSSLLPTLASTGWSPLIASVFFSSLYLIFALYIIPCHSLLSFPPCSIQNRQDYYSGRSIGSSCQAHRHYRSHPRTWLLTPPLFLPLPPPPSGIVFQNGFPRIKPLFTPSPVSRWS